MSRRARQHAELLSLCRAGALARALDLAQQHFGDFGPDDDVLDALAAAIDAGGNAHLRRRWAALRSTRTDPRTEGADR